MNQAGADLIFVTICINVNQDRELIHNVNQQLPDPVWIELMLAPKKRPVPAFLFPVTV